MKRMLFLMVAFSLTFCNTSHAQKYDHMERSFKKLIEDKLITMKERDNSEANLPKYNKPPLNYWSLSKSEYKSHYSYDIIKTNSVISPYKGIVTYYVKIMVKTGKTKDECLSSSWTVSDKEITEIYLYKGGKWVWSGLAP